MITCTHCQAQNGIDGKFCKRCGLALPDDVIRDAVARHAEMVAEGYSLFNANRSVEALLMAQAAVDQNPNSADAQSLLGMCLERTGQLAEALECFERALAISPDSALDRIKVTQIRQVLAGHMKVEQPDTKRTALIGAGLATLFIVALGFVVAALGSKPAVAQNTNPPPSPEAADTNRAFSSVPSSVVNAAPQPAPIDPQAVANKAANATVAPKTADSELPKATSKAPGLFEGQIPPLDPKVPTGIDPTSVGISPESAPPSTGATPEKGGDPEPKPTGTQEQVQPTPEPPKESPGIIEISVSRPSSPAIAPATGGGAQEQSPNQLQALMKTAREEFLLGRYPSAARSYEAALRSGGDPALVNQRLGMCYEKQGRPREAAAAYSSAVNAYQVAINSGQGDPKRLKSGLESCKQALKLLKG